jgi:hypothetical protein
MSPTLGAEIPVTLPMIVIAAAMGLILSARFRAPSLIAASVLLAFASVASGLMFGHALLQILIATTGALFVLQAAYLVGSWLMGRDGPDR